MLWASLEDGCDGGPRAVDVEGVQVRSTDGRRSRWLDGDTDGHPKLHCALQGPSSTFGLHVCVCVCVYALELELRSRFRMALSLVRALSQLSTDCSLGSSLFPRPSIQPSTCCL